MIRLVGKGIAPGVVIGRAAAMRMPSGIPILPASVVSALTKTRGRVPPDPVEVILFSDSCQAAASLPLPWAHVVGIAAGDMPPEGLALNVPAVGNLPDLLESVADDDLVLIDGNHGVVLVDPDSRSLAAYQADIERRSVRHRWYVDWANQPVRTIDGREIHVIARTTTIEEVAMAIGAGADAIYVPPRSALLPPEMEDDDQYQVILDIASLAVGKPVTIAGDALSVSLAALLRGALRAELGLAVPVGSGMDGSSDIAAQIDATREELTASEVAFDSVRIGGRLRVGSETQVSVSDLLLERCVVELPRMGALADTKTLAELDAIVVDASHALVPVELVLDDTDHRWVEAAVGLGVAGLIVSSDQVQAVKETIRNLDSNVCRKALNQRDH